MKLKSTLLIAILLLTSLGARASITINLGGDELFQSNGTSPIPLGSLIQLVASTTDNTFSNPTSTDFLGGSSDDVILASFASNNALGNGSFVEPITFNLTGNLTTGDQLLLRWWPSLTTASSTPGSGTSFGQFRTAAVENFSDINWTVPADGSTVALNFLDTSSGFATTPEPDSAGAASFITTAAVPEPSTYASTLLGLGGLGLVTLRRRFRK
jgi:hypothetical protein